MDNNRKTTLAGDQGPYEKSVNEYPLNGAQTGVYLECQEDPQSTKYNIAFVFPLPENVDGDRFEAAVRAVVALHPALGATLASTPDGPVMRLAGVQPEFTRRSAANRKEAWQSFVRPFDLEKGPLARFEICTTPEGIDFLLDIHHTVFDGTSMKLFQKQVGDAYKGKPLQAEDLPLGEAAFVEKDILQSEKYRAAQQFFHQQLEGVDCDCTLVPDLDSTRFEGDVRDAIYSCPMPLDLQTVEEFARRNGITNNTLFLGAYACTLSHFAQTPDALLSTASAGRFDPRLANTVGMFVKTLPLHITTATEGSVSDFLRGVRQLLVDSVRYDCISLAELFAQYGISPKVSYVYQSDLLGGIDLDGQPAPTQQIPLSESVSDLVCMVLKTAEGFRMNMHYRRELFSEALVRSFCETVATVAKSMTEVELMKDIRYTPESTRALYQNFNHTECGVPTVGEVCSQLDKAIALQPDATAIVYEGKTYTYAQLDRLTRGIAALIKSKGIGTDEFVAVLVPRNEYMVLGAWGVVRSGAAFQPLDPTYPQERLEYMVADSRARLVIADRQLLPLLGAYQGEVLFTDQIESLDCSAYQPAKPRPEDAITMIYTSGTTGKPKGCVLEHRNLAAFSRNHSQIMGIGPGSRVASYASFGFDAGVQDVITTPLCQATLYIIPDEIRLDLPALERFFCHNGITYGMMTTQLGRMFASQTRCSTLKAFTVGGEKLVPFTPQQSFRFINAYGPCETMAYICHHEVTDGSQVQPIGVPSPDTKLYVRSSDGQLAPVGALGELCIAGSQVGRGYLGLPEKTAEVFVPNPFDGSQKGYERMYRTGDIVRLLPCGEIEFIGRKDAQVKVRGFRVELTEIEEVVRRFEGIADATVAAFDDPAGGKFIAAYVVGEAPIDIAALEAFILAEKPAYMVPAVTMQIPAIPYNQNHKVNRRALPQPQRKAQEKVAPEGEVQQRMFDIAAEILGHTEFGVTTDLFQAGMTSIGLLKFNASLAAALGKAVKISDLKRLGNIRAIEAFLTQTDESVVWEKRDFYPIMQNQMGVFIESGTTAGSLDYNIPFLMKLSAALDAEELRRAVGIAIDAHPYLKTTLQTAEDGSVRACRHDDVPALVEIIELPALPGTQELVKPFTLLDEPLYRAAIYRTDDGLYFFMDVHHIVADGTSMGILLQDIDTALAGGTPWAEAFTGFEAALEEETLRSGEKPAEDKHYFKSLLDGVNTECLPAKCPEAAEGSAQASFVLADCSEKVLSYSTEHRLSLNAFMNAAFGYTLSQFIHSEDVSFCTVHNGRGDSRLDRSFAMLVKTIPVCCNPRPESKVAEYIRSVQDQLVSTMAAEAVSFAEISSEFGIKSDIFFNYQGDNFVFDRLGGFPAEVIALDTGASKAPLSFEVFLEEGRFRVLASWRRDCFCREFIESFVTAFETVAAGFTSTETLGNVELMSEREMAVFDKMNQTDLPFERVPAHVLFEREAARQPERIAVRTTDAQLSFAALDEMSDRLANALTAKGFGQGEIIGMILERSEYVPVAELGILKAGCAFLPMLPSYPKERIDFCIHDSGCRFCITEENVRQLVAEGAPDKPRTNVKMTDLAYCIYTSGSTGTPKGVMIEHHNLSNIILTSSMIAAVRKAGSILCMSSISFDMSISEILDSLCCGTSIYIASEEEIHNLDKLLAAFNAAEVDMMMMTPSFAWSLLSLPEFEEALSRLKSIVLGAEAFQPALLQKLKALNPAMLIMNGYGPTECTQACSAKVLEPGDSITIGGPFANTAYYVMNERGQLLPRYAVGELMICGECVGRGYIGLPEKNKAAFTEIRGVRAYHSGDLVRINRDLEAEFGGRKDNQVKIRGFRVELDEIETVMEEFKGVTRAKVVLRGSGSEAFLAGFFTADSPVDIEALTAHMKTKLTYYMIPGAIMQLDKMPMTQGGKLDAKALPEIKPAKRARKERRAPKRSLEQQILDEFRAATGIEDFYAEDNFFEMGGTSLSASKAVMKLKATGLKIEYQDIFDHQSAEELAEYLESQGKAATVVQATPTNDVDSLLNEVLENRETLKYNTLQYADQVERRPLGDVLLTGATGFLGCHILKELIESEPGRIICLMRKGNYKSAEARLQQIMFYYFSQTYAGKMEIVEGDITDDTLEAKLEGVHFDTLINSAACVKHFAKDDSIEFVNVHGVENLIGICQKRGARMIQISTTSIPGAHTEETYRRRVTMPEDRLFYVDDTNNQYCQSKYKAEQLMLAAIREGMSGKIIRVGNLMGRHSDGEFQINSHTNAFLRALRGFIAIGKCPISHATDKMGLSPIDCTARAVVLLAGTNDCFTAFNADNRWWFDEMKIMESVNRCGFKVTPVPDKEYYADFYAMMADAKQNEKVSALLTNDRPDLHTVDTDNCFTANVLYRLGFSWPFIDDDYLDKVINALATLDFFE